jgi:hypothetical protein
LRRLGKLMDEQNNARKCGVSGMAPGYRHRTVRILE